MLHQPAASAGKDYAIAYKTRLGVRMFVYYSIFYVGFVLINLSSPKLMEAIVFLGLNLATVYGFALITVALIQALIYSALCSRQERLLATQDREQERK